MFLWTCSAPPWLSIKDVGVWKQSIVSDLYRWYMIVSVMYFRNEWLCYWYNRNLVLFPRQRNEREKSFVMYRNICLSGLHGSKKTYTMVEQKIHILAALGKAFNRRYERQCYFKTSYLFFIGWKTFWEKEKMLVTSIFSISHNVFKRTSSLGVQKVVILW